MDNLLTTYLYEYKNCPLPSVGCLMLQSGHALHLPGEKKMTAPIPHIALLNKEIPAYSLWRYIASQLNVNINDAETLLKNYCDILKQIKPAEELVLSTAGNFYADDEGLLHFKSAVMPSAYTPDVVAERVIHQDVAHHMIVGDSETDTMAMSHLLNDEVIVKKSWLIPAIVLGLISVLLLIVYFSYNDSGSYGNTMPVDAKVESKTYHTPN